MPNGFWDSKSNQLRFFESLCAERGFESLDGFYSITTSDIDQAGGGGLLASKFNRSFILALQSVYPRHVWQGWRFSTVPSGFWDDEVNRRAFFTDLFKERGIDLSRPATLSKVSISAVRTHGGSWMLQKHYKNSISDAISELFPAQRWRLTLPSQLDAPKPEETNALEREQHDNYRSILSFFVGQDSSGAPQSLEKLYEVSPAEISAAGGGPLMRTFSGSVFIAARVLYPHHHWQGWKFKRTPTNFWRDLDNQREFFLNILSDGKQAPLTVHSVAAEDFHSLTTKQVIRAGGGALLQEYHSGKLENAVKALFPTISTGILWWKLNENGYSKEFWADQENRNQSQLRSFLAFAAQHPSLMISNPKMWERVSQGQLRQARLSGLSAAFAGLLPALHIAYPEIQWSEKNSSSKGKASTQRLLAQIIRRLLPENVSVREAETVDGYELDAFVPELNLAFEYQGAQHSSDLRHVGEARKTRETDSTKAAALQKRSISLIEVPGSHSDAVHLDATWIASQIKAARPGLKLRPSAVGSSASLSRQFFDSSMATLSLRSMDDWYSVSLKRIQALKGGAGVLKRHGNSLREALASAYPNHMWLEWRFKRVPVGFWESPQNRRSFFIENFIKGSKSGDLESLYELSTDDVIRAGGGGLLANKYSGSLIHTLKDSFPEHEWLEWRFSTVPLNFWSHTESQKAFVEWFVSGFAWRLRCFADVSSVSGCVKPYR